jgi:pyruvate kinase
MKNTKLICTIGPASQDKKTLKKLIKAGMNGARLNFSHGTYEQFSAIIKNLKELRTELKTPISIIQDLQGPKIRIGKVSEHGVIVKKGQKIILDTEIKLNQEIKSVIHIPLQYKKLPKDIKLDDPILIDDGKIELEAIKVNRTKTQIECIVKNNGILFSNKGLNAPKTNLSIEAMSKKDLQDLKFGLEQDVDFVALSFVRSEQDIVKLRNLINKANKYQTKIIAKIERPEAMQNLTAIINETDAVMVARGDLGIEIPAENVPIAQKRIIQEANKQGKPVITATHVLNSMVENPLPTRAEISDAANAIFDKTDCIMLSNETAVGLYPVEACQTLNNVAVAIEAEMKKHKFEAKHVFSEDRQTIDAICNNAVELAIDIQAKYLVTLTKNGYTAGQVSKNRAHIETIILTPNQKTCNQMGIFWGIHTVIVAEDLDFQNPSDQVRKILLKNKLVKSKDEIVIVNSVRNNKQRLITTFEV